VYELRQKYAATAGVTVRYHRGQRTPGPATAPRGQLTAALLAAGRPHQVLPLPGSHRLTAEAVIKRLLLHQLHFLREALNVPAPAAM
jgi:hypothetical protein